MSGYTPGMTRFTIGQRQSFITVALAGFSVLAVITTLALLLSSSQYNAIASSIQAIAVIPAITIAALALTGDNRGKRVDRVLDFHKEFNSGEIQKATVRLTAHLRDHGVNGRARPMSRDELRHDPALSKYNKSSEYNPRSDILLILRFFERVNAARMARVVDSALLVELIGRHAAWWNMAIQYTDDEPPRVSLRSLTEWADDFASANQGKYSYLRNWGKNLDREFGSLAERSGYG
jgi:hypothetical protein